ncbi:purine-nucleoside phosphorylase [Helicobacter sp. 11S03491-1]|uniref:phosphorylase family protein n=1 Tax=Helicobacter sp. 11S03491-1 TaxID=1476196 RepID=UPI000BA5C041|nr:purine-nucleoside phosphorylase [Helicobacter sp. 11S03491-1]PAF43002.1 hypothetical protein BKH45_02725 [Helicobacter sp. 11S03491-1]
MFICAGNIENFSFAKPIGIGLIESAINLSKICSYECVNHLIFVGTAGAYTYKIKPFEIYRSTKATQIEMSYVQQNSYSAIDNQIEIATQKVSRETNIAVNSSNYIHTDMEFSNKMVQAGIFLENMEFFSILKTAQMFDIECYGIFCVTNYCDANAHEDFLKNHQKAKIKLEKFIRENYTL